MTSRLSLMRRLDSLSRESRSRSASFSALSSSAGFNAPPWLDGGRHRPPWSRHRLDAAPGFEPDTCRWRRVIDASRTGHAGSFLDRSPRRDRGRGHTASLQWAPQGKATVLDVRPTESPLTCLPRSGLSSAHVSSRTRAFNRNKSPHVSRLRGRRSQRRGEVGSWDVSVVDAHPDRSSPKWPSAGRSLLFSKETRGCGQSAVHKI